MQRFCVAVLCVESLIAWRANAAGPDLDVPFDFLHNQVVLQVTVNGRGPYNFVLDSGTQTSTIDLRLAKQLRLPLSALTSGRAAGRKTFCDELDLAGLKIKGLTAVALDLSKPSTQLGRTLHGVLGHNFLAPRITEIDYFHRRIRFYRDSPPSAPDSGRRISFPMRFRPGSVLPVLEDCFVNGMKIPVTIDTGSSLGLILFPKAVRYLGLEDLARDGIPLEAAGYAGRARLMKGWARSVALHTIDLGAIEVAYVRSGYGEDEEIERRGGNLGNAVLQDFVLTLDYPHHQVVLEAADR